MATKVSSTRAAAQDAIDAGAGILRLEPCWVPRTFMIPGRRLRLHPDDLYALGAHRGGINERWFSSTTHASNGPGTPDDEGLSYVRVKNGARVLFKSLVDEGGDLCRNVDAAARGRMEYVCKFSKNGAIPHHSIRAMRRENWSTERQARGYTSILSTTRRNAFTFVMGLDPARRKTRRRCGEWSQGEKALGFPRRTAAAGTGWQHPASTRARSLSLRAAVKQRRFRLSSLSVEGRRRSQSHDEGSQAE